MNSNNVASKVPEVTFLFWVLKILATTLGETGGDAVSMSMGLGYLVSTVIFGFAFIFAVLCQMYSQKFVPVVYWATIIATTTVGTTLADFTNRSLGIGYAGGASTLLVLLMSCLFLWHKTLGSISIETVISKKSEMFYWATIMFSQTLGTALGDWVADTEGLGYAASAMIFSSALLLTAIAYFKTEISRVYLFWFAFIITRPLGAVVGDFLDKPLSKGGLALSQYSATTVLLLLIVILIFSFQQKAANRSH